MLSFSNLISDFTLLLIDFCASVSIACVEAWYVVYVVLVIIGVDSATSGGGIA